MQVTRLRNPMALQAPTIRAFFEEALAGNLWCSGPLDTTGPFLEGIIVDPLWGVFVANEGLDFTGLAVVMLPEGPETRAPQVVHMYANAKGAKAALVREVMDFVRLNGYTKFWAINATDKPDSIWKRAFKKAGNAERIGSIMEFDLESK